MSCPSLPLLEFPPELVERVTHLLLPSDLQRLSLAGNHDLAVLCIRALFRSVYISTFEHLVQFCQRLEQLEGAWRLVQNLEINLRDQPAAHAATFLACMLCLRRLDNLLTFKSHGAQIVRALLMQGFEGIFPVLQGISIPILDIDTLSSFFDSRSSHTMRKIEVFSEPCDLELNENASHALAEAIENGSQGLSFPNLRTFHGPDWLAVAVLPGSLVERPTIVWTTPLAADDPILQVVFCRRLAGALKRLDILLFGWKSLDMRLLADAFPELTHLTIRNHEDGYYEDEEEHVGVFFANFVEALPQWKKLESILVRVDERTCPETPRWMDCEADMEETLKKLCPSLKTVQKDINIEQTGWGVEYYTDVQ